MKHRRIAYLTGCYPRPTDTFIQREVAALRGLGTEVDTFAVRAPGDDLALSDHQQNERARTTYLLQCGVRRIVLAHLRLATRPARYLRALRLAWSTRRPGVRGTAKQAAYFAEAGLLASLMRSRRIEHVHAHFGDTAASVAMLAAAVGGHRYSFTLHGPGIFFEAETWQVGAKCDRAEFVACISHFARSQAMIFADASTASRLAIVHCGVPAAGEHVAAHGQTPGPILFVARLDHLKGLQVLIDALPMVRDLNDHARIVVIGDGPHRRQLEAHAAERGVADRIEFVGYQTPDEVRRHLADASVFALPSFAEGVPVSIMEAMAAGLPVVATNVGGVTELVRDGHTGDVVPPGDTNELADRLSKLLGDPELRRNRGIAGQAVVAEHFDVTAEAQRLQGLFDASGDDRRVRTLVAGTIR